MAIFHLSVKLIGRSSGRSAIGAAAYRSGTKLTNSHDGLTHDYTAKSGIVHTEILLPDNAPKDYFDRSTLWNAVEQSEKRRDAQTAREIEIALPTELNRDEQIKLIRNYVITIFVQQGMCADMAIHDKEDGNPHVHIMLTTRHINEEGFGQKNREWNNQANVEAWRSQWADHCNTALEQHQSPERIDHRSFERQGKEQIPTVHLGSAAYQQEKRGILTDRGDENRRIHNLNVELAELTKQEDDLSTESNLIIEDIWAEALSNAKYAYAQALLDHLIALDSIPESKIPPEPSKLPILQKQLLELREAHKQIQILTEQINQLQTQKDKTWRIFRNDHQKLDRQISDLNGQRGWYMTHAQRTTANIYGTKGYESAELYLQGQIKLQQEREAAAETQRRAKEKQRASEIREQRGIPQLEDHIEAARRRLIELCEGLAGCPDENQLNVHTKVRHFDTLQANLHHSSTPQRTVHSLLHHASSTTQALQTVKRIYESTIPGMIKKQLELEQPQTRDPEKDNRGINLTL